MLDGSCGALWASSDPNVNVKINGGLTYIDEFGQKVSSEGNYRIEVRAEPGEAQVQNSNIMTVAEYGVEVEIEKITEPITQTVYEIETINQTSGDGWKFENGSLVINGSGTYDIRGTQGADAKSSPNIIVKSGAEAKIFLTDINIDKSGTSKGAFQIEAGASAEVLLTNSNTLKGGTGHAGLEVPDGAELKLVSADGKGKTTGSLKAEGGSWGGSGIGGPGNEYSPKKGRAGNIIILGGTIEGKGATGGAGIGGGNTGGPDGGGTITIYGGKITAWGGDGPGGAGIGSGFWADADINNMTYTSDNTSITIYNIESLDAYGGSNSAGIGGSWNSSAGNIKINKRLFDENRINAVSGCIGAERIGWGYAGNHEGYFDNNDNNINLNEYFSDNSDYNIPDRPTITAEATQEKTVFVYEEVTHEVTREVTRNVTKKVDKIIGERVIDEIPYIKGLNGDFIFKPKKLGEISQFYDESGKFLVSQPQTITITQGNGKTASVTLYETDTMYDAAEKINNVIANTFGNAGYTDNPNKFSALADGTDQTSESVYVKEPVYSEEGYLSEYGFEIPAGTLIGYKITSTMLVRSAIPGKAGELSFSGDE